MIIDGHSHVCLPVEKHIHLMDKAGVDKTVLFYTSIHPETASNFADVKKEMQRLKENVAGDTNLSTKARIQGLKEQKDAISLYPSRFIGFGSIPGSLTDFERNEYIEKEVIGNGFVGLGEFTLPSGFIQTLRPIFKSSANFGNLPLWIHAFHPLTLPDIKQISQFAKEFPSVPVIIGHLGGSNWLETVDLVKETPNLYLDISAYFSTFVLKIIINELPLKCIFGVDMPYGDLQLSLDAVRKLSNSNDVTKAVLGENIAVLLNL
ncbi:amidohydrolase family protein [Anaerosacchariphilus polymeriproducens]|uniref:Amidohydrolase n=1 Tax=Anaerosacchariphilus polymeriproducens TaxID=1812858 RepID=A0A371AYC6_9FIRM|nr:amidohydrolase family protein [Anaerosacchariphilus polymeriproducens]RDU24567.1 amidohydrolase [Anaerosacchariphilus polymeriproducens]